MRRRRSPRNRETLVVLALAGAVAIGLTVAAMSDSSPGSLSDAMWRAVASIDPGAGRDLHAADGPTRSDPGKIVVAGLPQGFYVRLDGIAHPRGVDPDLEIPATPGSHRVEIVNRDGEAWVTRVVVPAGGGSVTTTPELAGEIVVESTSGEPIPGDIYLDGDRLPRLPAYLDSVAVGNHTVEIRSDSAIVWRSEFVVRNASVTRVEVPKVPSPGGN